MTDAARGRRARRWPARTRGSSAAPSATRCWAGRRPTSTSRVAGDPEAAARAIARAARGTAFELSGAFGAWRVVGRERGWNVDLVRAARRRPRRRPRGPRLHDQRDGRAAGGRRAARSARRPRRPRGAAAADGLGGRARRRPAAHAAGRAPGRRARRSSSTPRRARRCAGRRPAWPASRPSACSPSSSASSAPSGPPTGCCWPRTSASRRSCCPSWRRCAASSRTSSTTATSTATRSRCSRRSPRLQADAQRARRARRRRARAAGRAARRRPHAAGGAMRFAALLHDAAKPATRGFRPDGRVTFIGHDSEGAELARDVLRRLRASQRVADYVAALTLHHLRLGFLVHERPLSRRGIWRYLAATEPVRGRRHDLHRRRPPRHARAQRRAGDRRAPRARARGARARVRAPRRAAAAAARARRRAGAPRWGSSPGPQLGRLLAALEEARYAGEIASREEAISLARSLLT